MPASDASEYDMDRADNTAAPSRPATSALPVNDVAWFITPYGDRGRKGGAAIGLAPAPSDKSWRTWESSRVEPPLSMDAASPVPASPVTVAATRDVFELSGGRVFSAGIAGAAVMLSAMYLLPPLVGMGPMEMPKTMGEMFLPNDPTNANLIGMAIHFATGILFTFAFAGLLRLTHTRSDAARGLWFGVALWAISGIVMPYLMALHPLVLSGQMANPGFFLHNLGPGGVLPGLMSLLQHILFGVTIGGLYQHRVRTAAV